MQGYPAESVLALRRGQKRGVAPDAARRTDEAVEEWDSAASEEDVARYVAVAPRIVEPPPPPPPPPPPEPKVKGPWPQWSGEGRCYAI